MLEQSFVSHEVFINMSLLKNEIEDQAGFTKRAIIEDNITILKQHFFSLLCSVMLGDSSTVTLKTTDQHRAVTVASGETVA